jgi:uncharacterized membrane protein HdeD (DUF308 family)
MRLVPKFIREGSYPSITSLLLGPAVFLVSINALGKWFLTGSLYYLCAGAFFVMCGIFLVIKFFVSDISEE